MKKNNLFKAVGIVILAYILLSWIVPIVYSIGGFKGEVSNQIGFVSIINVVLETFSGFGGVVLFVLLVGAFYGVLKATGAYDKIMNFLSEKATGREKCMLITIIVVMALVSSIAGLDVGLLVVFPLLIGLVVKMGYDKMVALSATVGATIIGMYGATLAGTLYGINNQALSLKTYSQIAPKIVLFVLGVAAFIFAVVKYCESKKLVFDEKSARKTLLIEGIVVLSMALISSSVLVIINLMNEKLVVAWVVVASLMLIGLVFSVFKLSKNLFKALLVLFAIVLLFSTILLVLSILDGSFSVLWTIVSSLMLIGLVFSVFKLSNKKILNTLMVLFALLFVFGLVLVVIFATVKSVANLLWIIVASVSLAALIALIIVKIKKADKKPVKKASAKKNNTKVKKTAVKAKKDKAEKGAIPGLVVLCLLSLIFFLGTTAWGEIFKSNWFTTAHSSWTGVKIGGFEILNKLFGGVDAFGTWLSPNRFQTYSLLLVIAMVALKFIYRTKWENVFEGFIDGLKSFVVPTILTILACSVFVFVFYNPFISTVTNAILTASKEFNVVGSAIYTIINSVFYVDYYYLANSLLPNIASVYDDPTVLSVFSVIFTNLYALVMLIAPTSVLLLVSLSISDVKYTDWIKYIWKLALALFIISFVVFIVMVRI